MKIIKFILALLTTTIVLSFSNHKKQTAGSVNISTDWSTQFINCNNAYTVVIGLGYTSNDVSNEAYFKQSTFMYSPAQFTATNLTPGNYYYKAKKTYNVNCGTGQGIPQAVTKLGSFTIIAGQTTNINVGSLN